MRKPAELRPYQQRIATHLYENNEAICVARMGGGKTAAALTAITELERDGVIRHALVVAPKRVARSVWPDEIRAWEHTSELFLELTGTPAQRRLKLNTCGLFDLTLVGIDLIDWLIQELNAFPPDHPVFDLLVIDEISKLRSPTGVRAKLMAKHAPRWKMIWGLSGTLRPNSALDLFMPARIVSRDKLWGRSFYAWRKQHFYPTDYHGYEWAPFEHAEAQLNAEIAPLTVTLRDQDMPQLPALSVILDRVELPPPARITYSDMHRKLFTKVRDRDVLAASAAVATGKLAQIANGFLYAEGTAPEERRLAAGVHDEKRHWLEDLIEDVAGPLLVVYQFIEDLRMIREVVGHCPAIGDGSGDADSIIKDWNAGKLPILALHPAAGGHGLNLQSGGADMAWISPTWSPEMWEQTIARLHRPGQTRPVMVRVCVANNTVDEMKLDRVHGKMTAQAAFERYLAAHGEVRS
jgi:SNF2-related domain